MLILAATPIGNLSDASQRLREVLASSEHIAAEDTRTLKQLASALSVWGVCSCLYLPQPNHLVWTFTEPYRLTFLADPTRTGRLFGLPTNVDLTGTQIESTQPINPPPVSNLCLHVEGVTPYRACNAATDASTVHAGR